MRGLNRSSTSKYVAATTENDAPSRTMRIVSISIVSKNGPSPRCRRCLPVSRQREAERGPCPQLRFHPDAALVTAHNLAANRQTHAAAGRLVARLQASENAEDLFGVLGFNADSVVFH